MTESRTSRSIVVKGTTVTIATRGEQDYISLSDMVRNFDGQGALIEQWLRAKDNVLFLGVWEQLNNPDFKSLEFEGLRNEAGRNSFYLSVKKWVDATGAIGLPAPERLPQLNAIAIVQVRSLVASPAIKRLVPRKKT